MKSNIKLITTFCCKDCNFDFVRFYSNWIYL